jgi:hypothetical protein
VRNEEVLRRVKEQRNILHEISKRKANWIGHILCRNCTVYTAVGIFYAYYVRWLLAGLEWNPASSQPT